MIVLLATAVALPAASTAWAEERLPAGTTELSLGGAISTSHSTKNDLDTVTSLELIPHVGWIVSDAHGPEWVGGNFELLLEPTLIHVENKRNSATVIGASALARWIFSGTQRFRPYVEAGGGILVGETNFRQTDCDVNFLLQGGPGVLVFLSDTTSLSVGYRFQHISNGGSCRFNVGINSSALYLGVSYFFR